MKNYKIKIMLMLMTLLITMTVQSTVVRFETTVGNIDIDLFDDEAPITVANFLNYVNRGDYDGTAIHRTDPGFVIQGGGFRFLGNNVFETVPTDDPIVNEAQISNTVRTIAMARTSDPDSATNQWFFNLANNTFLDPSSGNDGFTVFGEVTRGEETLHIIESLLRINFFDATPSGAFGEFPLYRYDAGPNLNNPVLENNVVEITRAFVLSEEFQINPGISGGWFNPETSGQGLYFEVLPSTDTMIMAWFVHDSQLPDVGVPSNVGDAGNRWLTASGTYQDNQFVADVLKISGGLFDNPTPVSAIVVGEVMITFNNCSTAVMSYTLDDSELTNTINIQRVSGVNVDFCEDLAIETDEGASTQ